MNRQENDQPYSKVGIEKLFGESENKLMVRTDGNNQLEGAIIEFQNKPIVILIGVKFSLISPTDFISKG